jgi:serine/threonine protein kinase
MVLPPAPARLGQYQIVRRLAFGGMAEVFLGRTDGADGFAKDVVIKRVLPQHCQNLEFVAMFRDEARITAQLFHGNIVQVVEFGESEGQHYLVLEYVNGPSLSRTLAALKKASRRLSVAEAAHIAAEVARALDYAHRKRGADGAPLLVVHRDVTPSNILLSREGEVKLADFGIARARARLSSTSSESGVLKGKLAYMAPEMLRTGATGPMIDLFALGAVLYAMLSGSPAFRGDTEAETISRILSMEPEPLERVAPEVPAELAALVAQLLEKDPARRPERAMHVADALARIVPATEAAAELLASTLHGLETAEAESAQAATSKMTRRLLLVHESKTVRAVLRAKLEPQYGVLEASSIDEALELFRTDVHPDLVLCQRALDVGRGLDVCRRLRDESGATIVLLATEDTPEVRAEAERHGARGVATQSFSTAKLIETLQRAVLG